MTRLADNEAEVMCVKCGWTQRVRAATAIEAAREASGVGIEHRRERHRRWRVVRSADLRDNRRAA